MNKILVQAISEKDTNENQKVLKEIHNISDIGANDVISVKVISEEKNSDDEIIIMGKVLIQEIEKNSGTWDDVIKEVAESLLKKFN